MEFTYLSFNDWITVFVLIAQAGIVYYRLKKVEQRTEKLNDLIIDFAVQKNSLENHRNEFEKQSVRIESIIQKLDDRVSGIESHAYEAILKQSRIQRDQ